MTSSTDDPEFASAATNESSAPAAAATAKRSLCFEESQELGDAASTATSDSDADVLASLSNEIPPCKILRNVRNQVTRVRITNPIFAPVGRAGYMFCMTI